MYQAWPWGGTTATTTTTTTDSTYLQSAAAVQVAGATTQWPAGYSQYALTPEMQQQWAAWASQAQLAYGTAVAAGQVSATAYAAAWPEGYQAVAGYEVGTDADKVQSSSNKNSKNAKSKPDKSTDELIPKDTEELEKFNQLKAQAEQWKSQRQPTSSRWSYVNDQDSAITLSAKIPKASVNDVKEEEEFERQFNDWEKQFEAWKKQNINHPDKEAFARYEKQWQEWRSQLLLKKEKMLQAKAERLAREAQEPSAVEDVGDSKAYYQNSAYMYMQQPYSDMYAEDYSGQGYPDDDPNRMPLLPLPGMDSGVEDQDADWQYSSRGRGRGGRSRGRGGPRGRRGGRWSAAPDAYDMEQLPQGSGFPPNQKSEDFTRPPYDDYPADFVPEEGSHYPGAPPRDEFPSSEGHFRGNRMPPEGYDDRFPRKAPRDGFPDDRGGPRDFPPEDHFPGGPPEDRFRGRPGGRPEEGFPPYDAYDFPGGRKGFPPDDRFPRDRYQRDRFPPRDGDRFMGGREYDDFPPHMREKRFNPPFSEDFPPGPPFRDGDMMPRGRGRFSGPNRDYPMRPNRDFPPEEFDDRYPGPPDRMRRGGMRRGGPYRNQDFPPPDDGFGYGGGFPPDRMPPRKRPPGPPFDEPGFGPRQGPGFPDDPYYDEGPPMQFKTIDYTHRSASSVLDEKFKGNYEYENKFESDVGNYRDNFRSDCTLALKSPIIFSQVSVEAFDYDHGLNPMTTSTTEPNKESKDNESASVKVYDYAHRREKSPVHPDREYDREGNNSNDEPPGEKGRFRDPSFRDGPRGASERGGHREPPFRDRGRDFRSGGGGREPPHRDGPFRGGPREFRDSPRDEPAFGDDQRKEFVDEMGENFRDGSRGDKDSFRDDRRESFRDRDYERSRDRARNRDRDQEEDGEKRENRSKDRELDAKRDKDWDRDRRDKDNFPREKRYRWDKPDDKGSDKEKQEDFHTKNENGNRVNMDSLDYEKHSETFKGEPSTEAMLIKDLLIAPARLNRPKQLVIILRGLPGSGKTYVAKLIKDKEIENGGSAPRILSLDDYFMVESEKTETDPESGKKVTKKEFEYEYEHDMEEAYRSSLFKSFKKTVDDRFFPFIIIDAVHDKSKQYDQYWSYAKQRGFEVYIAEMDCLDPVICHKRNIHKRTLEDINKLANNWERKPRHFLTVDVRSLLQDVAITEVEMEVENSEIKEEHKDLQEDDFDEENAFMQSHVPSRWEKLEATEDKLDKLDGLNLLKKKHSSMEDYLQLPDDDYEEKQCEPGKKRVRWADLEERKEQDRLRAIGFVVGQTDWSKLTDPSHADKALTKTKYF